MELFESLSNNFKTFLRGPEDSSTHDILPYSMRYKMKYAQPIEVSDLEELASDPQYNILVPYFAIESLNDDEEYQRIMIQNLANGFIDSRPLTDTLIATYSLIPEHIPHPVKSEKIARVALWTPSLIRSRAQEELESTRTDRQLPVIIGNGGLLTFETMIQILQKGDQAFIIFPKKLERGYRFGYKINRDESLNVSFLSQADLQTSLPIAIIDDAAKTGETLELVESFFFNSQVIKRPLFTT